MASKQILLLLLKHEIWNKLHEAWLVRQTGDSKARAQKETQELEQMHTDERAALTVELAVVSKSLRSVMAKLDALHLA
jgi:hypothetical protein